jgi:hypothetical protein
VSNSLFGVRLTRRSTHFSPSCKLLVTDFLSSFRSRRTLKRSERFDFHFAAKLERGERRDTPPGIAERNAIVQVDIPYNIMHVMVFL